MSLLNVYDELLGDVAGGLSRASDEIRSRNTLLRDQLGIRLEQELGFDEHSFALPALAAYLGNAVRLYLLGFYDAAIIEAESRLAAALQPRLQELHARTGRGEGRVESPVDPVRPLDRLLDGAVECQLFSHKRLAPERTAALVSSARELARKRLAIDVRNRDQGLQITVVAPASGARSGGPGAAHTEPILGYYLSWGANLHHLLVDAVIAVALILMSGDQATSEVAPGAPLLGKQR